MAEFLKKQRAAACRTKLGGMSTKLQGTQKNEKSEGKMTLPGGKLRGMTYIYPAGGGRGTGKPE